MSAIVPTEITLDHYNEALDSYEYPRDLGELSEMTEELSDNLWEYHYGEAQIDDRKAVEDFRKLTGAIHQWRQLFGEKYTVEITEEETVRWPQPAVVSIEPTSFEPEKFPGDFAASRINLLREATDLSRRLTQNHLTDRGLDDTDKSNFLYERVWGILSYVHSEYGQKVRILLEEDGPAFVVVQYNSTGVGRSSGVRNTSGGGNAG